MNTCDNGCKNGLGVRENPSYRLQVVEPYTVSKVYKFCSVGCLIDWVQLSSQGLRTVEFPKTGRIVAKTEEGVEVELLDA